MGLQCFNSIVGAGGNETTATTTDFQRRNIFLVETDDGYENMFHNVLIADSCFLEIFSDDLGNLGAFTGEKPGSRHKNYVAPTCDFGQASPESRSYYSAGAVSLYCTADFFACGDADTTRRQVVFQNINNNGRINERFSSTVNALKFFIKP